MIICCLFALKRSMKKSQKNYYLILTSFSDIKIFFWRVYFSSYVLPFVPLQNHLCQHKKQITNHLLVWHKIFGTGTKCISIFGQAQNILERVEGQGIR
jgi:hypothetical protein